MSEIQDAVQIIRVCLDGIDIFFKIGKANWQFVQGVSATFARMLDQEKLEGKTSVKKLLKSGGDLQVFKFKTEDLRTVEKLANKYGILYSILPDINKKDGMSEILFHSQALPRIQSIMEQIQGAGIESMDDYFANAEPKALDTLTQAAREKYGEMNQGTRGEAEIFPSIFAENGIPAKKMEGIKNFQKGYVKNPNIDGITIAKKMVVAETEQEIKTRIPYKKDEYIWLPKSEITWINNDKTIYAGLEKEREYQVVDGADNPVRQVSGQELYKQSYDPVKRNLEGREQEWIQRRQNQEWQNRMPKNQQQSRALQSQRQGQIQQNNIPYYEEQDLRRQDRKRQNQNAQEKMQNRMPQNRQTGNTRKRNGKKKEEWKPVQHPYSGVSNNPARASQGRRVR